MKKLIGVAICLAVAGVAFAAVTFDPTTGTGFVGKGDVQLAFGWNNQKLQENATGVTFTYAATNEYLVTEAWATGNPDNPWTLTAHKDTINIQYSVSAAINGLPRPGPQQFTGFNLYGFVGAPVIVGEIPETDTVDWAKIVYDRKIGQTWYYNLETELLPYDEDGNLYTEGNYKAVLSVELTSSVGGLYANYGGQSVLLQ